MFIILILVIVLWVYTDVNIYHTIHFKCMFSIVYSVKNNMFGTYYIPDILLDIVSSAAKKERDCIFIKFAVTS